MFIFFNNVYLIKSLWTLHTLKKADNFFIFYRPDNQFQNTSFSAKQNAIVHINFDFKTDRPNLITWNDDDVFFPGKESKISLERTIKLKRISVTY